ncbi:MAG: response regulator [Xanthobacteraceae bacterium]|uniref:response regulator n=1 Tax=Pseudolabrys sp. TaxID=1960880 RepID=UPI003D0B9363
MTADLISLKFLVVSGHEPFFALWRESARLASVPVEFVGAACTAAGDELAKGDIDMMILDGAMIDARREVVIAAARQCEPAPLIVIAAADGAAAMDGADLVVPAPGDLNAARAVVERLIRCCIPARVLIVDDSGTMRSIVKKVLSASRYTFDIGEATNGHEAITELKNGAFDVVILDYHMPGLNGLDILRAIVKMEMRIGVVMMTTTVDDSVAKAAIAEGATGFLKKPFYPADIDQVLDRYFESGEAR